MARQVKPTDATAILSELFPLAEDDYRDNVPIPVPKGVVAATSRLFDSSTQAYREALIGCAVARLADPEIDIRYPATEDGDNAFSGRSLADNAITPFMRERSVPISASPYLSSLRGGAQFIPGGQPRIQRDQEGFDALVLVVGHLHKAPEQAVRDYLRYLLRRFVELRESANIALKRFAKPSLEQLKGLIDGLLGVKSGGRIPSFLTTAMFQALSDCYDRKWEVEFQGINVADKFTGAVGDVTVKKDGKIVLGIEVTERSITKARVTAAFDEKISPAKLTDYLFVSTAEPATDARAAARSYTAVGHEMNFAILPGWLVDNLATIGPDCRTRFQDRMIEQLSAIGVPADLKLAWNEMMEKAIG